MTLGSDAALTMVASTSKAIKTFENLLSRSSLVLLLDWLALLFFLSQSYYLVLFYQVWTSCWKHVGVTFIPICWSSRLKSASSGLLFLSCWLMHLFQCSMIRLGSKHLLFCMVSWSVAFVLSAASSLITTWTFFVSAFQSRTIFSTVFVIAFTFCEPLNSSKWS